MLILKIEKTKTAKINLGQLINVLCIFGAISITKDFLPRILSPKSNDQLFGSVHFWYTPYLLIFLILKLSTYVGIWKRNKWAVYLFFPLWLIELLFAVYYLYFLRSDINVLIGIAIVFLVPAVFWVWIIRNQWQEFK